MQDDANQQPPGTAADDAPAAVEAWLRTAPAGSVLRTHFASPRYWLPGTTHTPRLHALLQRDARGTRVAIAPHPLQGDIERAAARQRVPVIDLEQPVPLLPLEVPKPWGREVWFTGIESRGVCTVGDAHAQLPLPDLLALAPEWICRRRERALVLLKILDPHPDPDFGELYLELHEHKREAYVVTAVDRTLWPEGTGALRIGSAPSTEDRSAPSSEESGWRSEFRAAIGRYEAVRRRIDEHLDVLRTAAGIALDATLALADARKLAARIPSALHAEERDARAAMHAYTRLFPLREGDTVAIPTHTPHALLPGVRVIEFQTPAYERRILAFTQKVLTQPHWDTDAAIANMRAHTPPEPPQLLVDDDAVRVECIVHFADFRVLRVQLRGVKARATDGGADAIHWQPPASDYAVCIGVSGHAAIEGHTLASERAMFIPNAATRRPVTNAGAERATFLWALPA